MVFIVLVIYEMHFMESICVFIIYHVFIYKLIPSELIYFEGRACYIGEINLYMHQIVSSFALDLIVKAVIVAGAACSSLLYIR